MGEPMNKLTLEAGDIFLTENVMVLGTLIKAVERL
jgi:hypothetical protein